MGTRDFIYNTKYTRHRREGKNKSNQLTYGGFQERNQKYKKIF
jgi:hypothetical protein